MIINTILFTLKIKRICKVSIFGFMFFLVILLKDLLWFRIETSFGSCDAQTSKYSMTVLIEHEVSVLLKLKIKKLPTW
jgi:hypothetical protein